MLRPPYLRHAVITFANSKQYLSVIQKLQKIAFCIITKI